jgi:hypothetical protein
MGTAITIGQRHDTCNGKNEDRVDIAPKDVQILVPHVLNNASRNEPRRLNLIMKKY